MDKKQKAGYMRQRQLHERLRKRPHHRNIRLSTAVERAGLKVVGYEYEVREGDWYGWYDVAVRVGDRLAFLDIPVGKGGRKNNAIMQRKIDYAEKNGHPLLIVKGGSIVQMQAEVELWLLKLGREARYG